MSTGSDITAFNVMGTFGICVLGGSWHIWCILALLDLAGEDMQQ